MKYSIIVSKAVKKQLAGIPKVYFQKISLAIDKLETEPYPHGSSKLQGSENKYRIRVGVYRIIYSVIDNELLIEIIKVGIRGNVYDS